MHCPPSMIEKSFCTGCEPGYILNKATNKCEGCVCTADYNPVCCNGKTYSNQCRLNKQQSVCQEHAVWWRNHVVVLTIACHIMMDAIIVSVARMGLLHARE